MPLVTITSRNADGSPVLKEGEQVLHSQPNVTLYFNPQKSEGNGTVYVTTMYVSFSYVCNYLTHCRNAIWLSSEDNNKGYSLDFPFISLHAVSRDTTHFPHQCLYCQLDVEVPEEDDDEDEEGMSDKPQNGTAQVYSEARFVPNDPQTCMLIATPFSQSKCITY